MPARALRSTAHWARHSKPIKSRLPTRERAKWRGRHRCRQFCRNPSSIALAAAPFSSPHTRFVHAEIMRDFVPDGFRNHFFQMRSVARQPLVRTLENDDLVGHDEAVGDAARGKRTAAVKP